jgi:hypothetical protein
MGDDLLDQPKFVENSMLFHKPALENPMLRKAHNLHTPTFWFAVDPRPPVRAHERPACGGAVAFSLVPVPVPIVHGHLTIREHAQHG